MATKFEALNKAAEIMGSPVRFYGGMTVDQFYQGVVDVLAAVPSYVDAEVEKRVKAQNHSTK